MSIWAGKTLRSHHVGNDDFSLLFLLFHWGYTTMNTINLVAVFQIIYMLLTGKQYEMLRSVIAVSSLGEQFKTAVAFGLDGKSNFPGWENTLFFKIRHVY